jgi:LmbE family N-acetylglucosaminyl deacetylase
MEQGTILAIFAHPDDEAFSVGGTLPWYTARGVNAALVCATRGEVGEIADPALATPETLAQVREAELGCAAQSMGVKRLIFLDYRDSGMAGTPENEDSRAFVNAPADEVVARLVGIIRQVRPRVVITFGPDGIYGHPDHVAIHRRTLSAFHAAANPARFPEQGEAWLPTRLFYTALPCSMIQAMRDWLVSMGEDTSEVDSFEAAGAGCPDDQVHAVLDVADRVEAKWEALNCHRTQFGPENLFRRLPEDVVKRAISQEHFTQAWPEPQPGLRLDDLLAD